ncbi:hypothetical protein ZWY2020_038325 [Hordeum vulgare]|nr:hypothetical protein ZWY2020_038325 [Hordeum vulgare]
MPPPTVPFFLTSTTLATAAKPQRQQPPAQPQPQSCGAQTPADSLAASYTARMRLNPHLALRLFDHLLRSGADPDPIAYALALARCARERAYPAAAQLHGHAAKRGAASHRRVRNGLIHAYSVCGMLFDARKVFDHGPEVDMIAWNCLLRGYAQGRDTGALREFFALMPARDSVSWNTVIAWCVANGEHEEAVAVFREMLASNECQPDRVTLVSVISAIAYLGALAQGLWAHAYVCRKEIEVDEKLSSALINMYSKCGFIEGAVYVFENSCALRSVDTWNAMLAGFTASGCSERALELFTRMESSGFVPNKITFNTLLNACSHGGFVEEAGFAMDCALFMVYRKESILCSHLHRTDGWMACCQHVGPKLIKLRVERRHAALACYPSVMRCRRIRIRIGAREHGWMGHGCLRPALHFPLQIRYVYMRREKGMERGTLLSRKIKRKQELPDAFLKPARI